MTKKKKRNPADLTGRNLKAAKKREGALAVRVATLELRVAELERRAVMPKRGKR